MRPPCELIVRYVLPAFRSLVARELVKKYDFSQTEVAKRLGTTQATISYYLYSKRGNKRIKQLESISLVRSAASELAQDIATNRLSSADSVSEVCRLCKALKGHDLIP